MAKYIVKRAFQHRGAMWRSGQAIELDAAEAADRFIAARVEAAGRDGVAAGRPARNFTNGTPKKKAAPPAKAVAGEAREMSDAELKAALVKIGVPVPPNAGREELETQYAAAKAAVAGSPEEANGPKQGTGGQSGNLI